MTTAQIKTLRAHLSELGLTVKSYASFFSPASQQVYIHAQSAKMCLGVLLKSMGEPSPYKNDIQNMADISKEADKCFSPTFFESLDAFVHYVHNNREELEQKLKDLERCPIDKSKFSVEMAGKMAYCHILETRNWLGMVLSETKENHEIVMMRPKKQEWKDVSVSDEGKVTGTFNDQPVSGELVSEIVETPLPEFINLCERANAIKEELGN